MTCRVATTLKDMGVGPGKLVAFFGESSFQSFSIYFGVILTGGIISPYNPELKEGNYYLFVLIYNNLNYG